MATTEKKSLDERLKEFALKFKDDPNFYRLPFPEHILKSLGLYREKQDIPATEAVKRAYNMTNNEIYSSNEIEIRDYSKESKDSSP
jgi:hypothetical protein